MADRSPELIHQEFLSAAQAKVRHDLAGDPIRSHAVVMDIDRLLDEENRARATS